MSPMTDALLRRYWKENEGPWAAAHTIESSFQVVRPADTSSNHKRAESYNAWLQAAGI